MKLKLAVVSGGYDPIHIGHVRMFKEASLLADKLHVIINNDNWLMKKKGFIFMPEQDRIEIISSLKFVSQASLTKHVKDPSDMSVCNELKELKNIYSESCELVFCNGGDRKADNIPEYKLCIDLGIKMKFNVGGEKLRSSSELVKKAGNLK